MAAWEALMDDKRRSVTTKNVQSYFQIRSGIRLTTEELRFDQLARRGD